MAQETLRRRKNDAQKENEREDEKKTENENTKEVKPKYGPPITFPYQRVWSRSVLIVGVLLVVWYNSKIITEVSLAQQKDVIAGRSINVECSDDYKAELNKFPDCVPKKCGRYVSDKVVTAFEVDILLRFAKNGLKLGDLDGGVKILDLESGALSKGNKFINFYALSEAKKIFNRTDFLIYKHVKSKIQEIIGHHFRVDINKIYLTKPTFFSEITNLPAKTIHDEYWQPHVDKKVYESFHYTSLLYLSDYGRDFEGGRFMYIDKNGVNTTVEPRRGRVSIFTSGSENLHAVEKVTSGTRYALTVSFTCDKQFATSDPTFERINSI